MNAISDSAVYLQLQGQMVKQQQQQQQQASLMQMNAHWILSGPKQTQVTEALAHVPQQMCCAQRSSQCALYLCLHTQHWRCPTETLL